MAKNKKKESIGSRLKQQLGLPFIILAALCLLAGGLIVLSEGGVRSGPVRMHGQTLAFASDIKVEDLLAATNQERAAHGKPALVLNSKLNSAAQAKANHMIANNYWAHVSPEGVEPWEFIQNAGYRFAAAAENLASGFPTSSATIDGWMASPGHRASMLSTDYIQVGFGFANGQDFADHGNVTIVVGMYAYPSGAAPAAKPKATTKATASATTPEVSSKPKAAEPDKKIAAAQPEEEAARQPEPAYTSENDNQQTTPQRVNRLDLIFDTKARVIGILTVSATILLGLIWLYKHSRAFHRWVRKEERYILTHPVVDGLFVVLIILCIYLFRQIGVVL